jgi:hypothetical protein
VQDQDANVILDVDSVNNRVGIGTAAPGDALEVYGDGRNIKITNAAGLYARLDLTTTNNEYFVQVEDTAFDGIGFYKAAPATAGWQMVLTTAGNVGIGTAGPVSLLHIAGAGYFPANLISLTGAEPTKYIGRIGTVLTGVGGQIGLSFGTRGGNVDYDNTLIVTDGNVGIGLTAPQGRLHGKGSNSVGYFAHFDAAGIDNTGVVLIPDGAGDVTGIIEILYVLISTSATFNYQASHVSTVPGGTVALGSADGDGNIWSLRVNANGQVDVYRSTTGGAAKTATMSIWAVWI